MAFVSDAEEHYVLTLEPKLRATPSLFEPKQVQSAVSADTFTTRGWIFFRCRFTNFLESSFIHGTL